MSPAVLDTSAVLAWLRGEPGASAVEALLEQAYMSSVNWCETAQKLIRDGDNAERTLRRVAALGVEVYPCTATDALAAAQLWSATHPAGLSLGDRVCLALAARYELPVYTADTAWGKLDLGIAVHLIR